MRTSSTVPAESLVDIEDEVMCVTGKIPLHIAESPQATRERDLIRRLRARQAADQGRARRRIGPDVLALPDSDGFGMTAYAIPIALLAVLAAGLALLVPRWSSRAPAGIGNDSATASSRDDARRLDEELARYDR